MFAPVQFKHYTIHKLQEIYIGNLGTQEDNKILSS